MHIIKQSIEIDPFDAIPNGNEVLRKIERCGRVCYKSEDRISPDSAKAFAKMILKSGHHSVIEHHNITVRIICDRGISHEIVRHRIASYSQESTRYCNYNRSKFENGIAVIAPMFEKAGSFEIWEKAMRQDQKDYDDLIKLGEKPQTARSVLPTCLKTEIMVTYNLREWRHFLTLRTSPRAHPQIREIASEILRQFKDYIPVVFDDIEIECGEV